MKFTAAQDSARFGIVVLLIANFFLRRKAQACDKEREFIVNSDNEF